MIRFEEQTLVFSTGRHLAVHRCVVGLSPCLEVSRGYSGVLVPAEPFLDDDEALTGRARIELADFMISKWQAFKTASETR